MHRQTQLHIYPHTKLICFVLILTLSNQITPLLAATSLQSSHHHKHRHKHQFLTINSNQIHEIREAFDEYRNAVNKDNFEELTPLRHHHKKHHNQHHEKHIDDETMPAIHQQQHLHHAMYRHKRLNGASTTTKSTTISTTTTMSTTVKTIDNYDEEYDDDESDVNRRVSDDAHVQTRSSQVEMSNQLTEGESLTSYKMNNLGTREGVERSFQEMQKNNPHDLWNHVIQNIRRTKIDGLCRWPNKKVVEIQQHPTKSYIPRKYVIYQCSDDTSCCGSSDKTCVAKKYEELVYYFHVRYLNQTDGFEPLKVQNHTECECIYKNQPRQSPPRQVPPMNIWTTTTRRTPRQYTTTVAAPVSTTIKLPCKCPQTYESVFSNEGNCECKCERGGAECRLKYEGKEGFTMSDQRCILSRECTQPHCLYGSYQLNLGRCPDRNDKFNRGFSRQHHQQRL